MKNVAIAWFGVSVFLMFLLSFPCLIFAEDVSEERHKKLSKLLTGVSIMALLTATVAFS